MPQRILRGTVRVRAKVIKTHRVQVERQFLHPIAEKNHPSLLSPMQLMMKKQCHKCFGDKVRIIECPPKSKTKTWEKSVTRVLSFRPKMWDDRNCH